MRMKVFTTDSLRRMGLALFAAALLSVVSIEARGRTAYFLNIYSVTCWSSNDPAQGADEPYLKYNNDRIWTGPDCTPITTMYPNIHTDFWDHVEIRIMEDDFGSDDTVGYVNVTGALWGQGPQTYYSYKWIDNLGYVINYSMDFEVPA
jgi:hypothetical protein